MSANSSIEWTDATWNPIRGCTKVSPGCKHCYAHTFAERFRGVPGHPYEQGFDLRLVPEKLHDPFKWRTPKKVFVNSMSDLFQSGVTTDYIRRVVSVMVEADWHIYQVLTKRSSILQKFVDARYRSRKVPTHIWLGVSVENEKARSRIVHLQTARATTRFISIEPLIGPVGELDLDGIAWVIVGGESGPGARPMDPAWAIDIRNQCVRANVAFFFKQWGGKNPKSGGRLLEGEEWSQFPMEFPTCAA